MSPVEWFYAKSNQQFGPISPAELKQLAQSGQLTPDDLVWRPGMDDWSTAGRVKGLFETTPPAPVQDSSTARATPSTSEGSHATAARNASEDSSVAPTRSASETLPGTSARGASESLSAAPTRIASEGSAAVARSANEGPSAAPTRGASEVSSGSPIRSVSESAQAPPTRSASEGRLAASEASSAVPNRNASEVSPAAPARGVSDSARATPTRIASEGRPVAKEASTVVKDAPVVAKTSSVPVRDSALMKDSTAARDSLPVIRDTPGSLKMESPSPRSDTPSASNVFEGAPPSRRKASRRPAAHVLDHLLGAAKRGLTRRFVDASARIFGSCGYYGLYVAMGASALFALVAAVEGAGQEGVVLSLAVIPLWMILQYVSYRFLDALERLNRATPGRMDSTAVLDSFALLSFFLGTAALIGLAILAAQTHAIATVLSAVAVFILCQYLAVIAINPDAINITIGAVASAGEEALALISCLLKMTLLRITPVAYGVGIICGIVELIYAIAVMFLESEAEYALITVTAAARWAIAALCLSALLPVAAYLAFLFLHLGVDVLRGLVSQAEPSSNDKRWHNGSNGPR